MQRSRHQQERDVAAASSSTRRRAQRSSPLDAAMLAAQQLAGNAAVGALLGSDAAPRRDPDHDRVLPEPVGKPRVVVRLPVDITPLLTADGSEARGGGRRPSAMRLDWTVGAGERSIGPARLATQARTTRLAGTVQGVRPLVWDVPLTGAVGTLTPDLALKVRVGRLDLARGGNEATVSIVDDVVTLTIAFAAGQVRLVGELTEHGDAPEDWDAEVELDHRRCARLLAPRRGRVGSRSSGATAAADPPPEPPDGPASSKRPGPDA